MKTTIFYDNTIFRAGLKPDWDFSCLVELGNWMILFDTGADDARLLENIEKHSVDALLIDIVSIAYKMSKFLIFLKINV
jgi:metal-dependent hydrolase (beta-lactamase superfamily II)